MKKTSEESIISLTAHALSRLGVKSTSTVLAAVSGGMDSMSLLFILNQLRRQGHLKKLTAIHLNHSLRGKESDKDEKLVLQFTRKLRIPCDTIRVNTREYAIENRMGIEETARFLRYEKIGEVASRKKMQFIATAHTANDQAETVLMNIVRGTGLNGMQGIPQTRELSNSSRLIRPILGINKKELLLFAKKNDIPYREDASNESLDFQRNRVRHLVLPKLEQAFKDRDIYSGFSKMTQNIASVSEYITGQVEALRSKAIQETSTFFVHRKMVSLNLKKLLEAPQFLRRELIVREASALSGKLISLDYIQSQLMESYLSYKSRSGKPFYLTPEIALTGEGEYITLENIDFLPVREHPVVIGKKILTPVGVISAKKIAGWKKPKDGNMAYFKYDDISSRKLLLRYWKPGDKMKPFGMKGKSRLVSDILGEFGIKSERLKYFVPLIVFLDEPDFILWIPGIRSAEFGRLNAKSETALEFKRTL